LPTLLGQVDKQKKHRILYWEFHENKTTEQAVRMGNFKAVRHKPGGAIELYDLSNDIGEKHDISAAYPEVVRKITEYINNARTPSQYWPMKK